MLRRARCRRLGAGVLAFKLASSVFLKFMAPTFAALLKQGVGGGYGFEVGDAELSWSQKAGALAPRSRASISTTIPVFSSPAFLSSMSAFSSMGCSTALSRRRASACKKASILIERNPEGAFSIGAAQARSGNTQTSVLPFLLDSVFAPPSKRNAVSYLSEVAVEDADLTVIDRRTGITVRAPDARLKLVRSEHGFSGGLEATATVADERVAVSLKGKFDLKRQSGAIDASFSPVRLSHLAPLSNFYATFAPLDMPIGGQAHLDLGKNALITRADLKLAASGGQVVPGGKPDKAVAVQSAYFEGTYWPESGAVAIDTLKFQAGADRGDFKGHARLRSVPGTPVRVVGLSAAFSGKDIGFVWPGRFSDPIALDAVDAEADFTFGPGWQAIIKTAKIAFGPTRMEVSGNISAAAGSPAVKLKGLVTDFDASEIARYWPEGVAVHPRNWVTRHIKGGRIARGDLTIDAPAGAFAAAHVADEVLKFEFRVEDAEATYFGSLPPVKGASGSATLTANAFDMKIDTAIILGAKFSSGRVSIPQIGVPESSIRVEAAGAGRIEEILAILNHEPLNLITKYGLKPDEITGDTTLTMTLNIPQELARAEKDLKFVVIAKGERVTLPKVGKRISVDSGTLDLKITETGLEGSGRVALNGAPADIIWREKFQGKSAMPSEITVKTVLDEEARVALGYDTGTSLTGPLAVDLTARGRGPQVRTVDAKLDLTRSTINLADFGWTKQAGAPARINVAVAVDEDGAITAKQIRALGQGIDVSGTARLAGDGKLLAASFPRLHLDGLVDVALSGERTAADGLVLKLDGSFLRLGPLLKDAAEKSDGKMKAPWRVEATLRRAVLRNAVEVNDLRAAVASTGGSLKLLDARGRFADGKEFSANLSDIGQERRMVVESTDAGRLISGVAGVKSVVGGRLSLNARIAEDGAARPKPAGGKPPADVEGAIRVEDFKVVDAPLLARLLTIGSLQGLSDLLKGDGIQFARLQVPFWMEGGAIGIDDARAAGPAIGITLQGVINRKAETTELNGSIVPAYTLNSALGSVPVLGPLLISREGEGIFGFTYSVTGQMDEPRLMVNPLAALAPGFLRRLFELGDTQAGNARPAARVPSTPQ
ncbi:MAG: DUF3971 domain-containing protein [Alphaproteobacteria bacterium]